jgi:hypothetical protein
MKATLRIGPVWLVLSGQSSMTTPLVESS